MRQATKKSKTRSSFTHNINSFDKQVAKPASHDYEKRKLNPWIRC